MSEVGNYWVLECAILIVFRLDDTDGFAGQNGGLSDCMVVDAKHVLALPKEIPLDVGGMCTITTVTF